ncbi:MAG: orotate phosphoribosyltransferase [Saprospiraceae bacterium]|nr:orotate phosphoribosyltransferase [Saprospiraceae bacterium]
MDTSAEVAEKLLQIKAIKLSPQNPFTWASGIKSPIYCDNRLVLSYPDVRDFIKEQLALTSEEFGGFDRIAGVATAGIAHGMLLADALDKPFAYVRSKAKEHGRQNLVEGLLEAGDRVLVVEDLISTGGSSLQAVEAVRQIGCTVVGVIAIFSYGFERAETAFKEANCPFKTLSNYDDLIIQAVKSGYVDSSSLTMLTDWRKTIGK